MTPAGLKGTCPGSKQGPPLTERLLGAASVAHLSQVYFAIAQMMVLQKRL